jgi:hypothetical protein
LPKKKLTEAKKASRGAKGDKGKQEATSRAEQVNNKSIEHYLESELIFGETQSRALKADKKLKNYRKVGKLALDDSDHSDSEDSNSEDSDSEDKDEKGPAADSSASSAPAAGTEADEELQDKNDKDDVDTLASELGLQTLAEMYEQHVPASETGAEEGGNSPGAASADSADAPTKPRSHKRKADQVDMQLVPPGVSRNDAKNFAKAQRNPRQKRL